MDREIEIKLTYKNKEKVLEKLKKISGKFKEKYILEDIYFTRYNETLSNPNELLRIRSKNNKYELTFKGKNKENKDKILNRIELNVGISDPKNMIQIIEALGFNEISRKKSEREIWIIKEIELVFMKFLGKEIVELLEVEGPSEKSVMDIVSKLGDSVQPVGEEILKTQPKP